MNQVFLDTGYVLALELANDQNHHAVSDPLQNSLTLGRFELLCSQHLANRSAASRSRRNISTLLTMIATWEAIVSSIR